ncbi:hypothetical protein KGY73_03775 [bacterium]|nr:hypothetical protein [bacterium]
MSQYKYKPFSYNDLKTYPLKERDSKVNVQNFSKIAAPDKKFEDFIDSFPDILAGKDWKDFLSLMKEAKKKEKAIMMGLGAHVIKVGLNPVIIDLMERNWVTSISLNGAGIIHDFEVAFAGKTSEDVSSQIEGGRFGMARETGEMLNKAIKNGGEEGIGLGEAVGRMIAYSRFPFKGMSLLSTAYNRNIPVTVHTAVGTDIIHYHPSVNGEMLGKTSLQDFFLLCSLVQDLEGGGIYINVGSAVILPEVFLKAVTLVRNKGKHLEKFSTAVFDFIHHYRPFQNVTRRPLGENQKGFYFIGHHEIMIPLLAACLKAFPGKGS